METKLQQEINDVLKELPEYWNENTLLKNKLIEDIRSYNENVIEALLSNELIKDTYALQMPSGTVFKTEDFISMMRFKNYWDNSYTKYTNEIGLTSEDKYLNYNTDVVLDFPHKDSFLEGGMTKEDLSKKEIYYHNVIAKEEIDTLISPKVLSDAKRYSEHGVQDIENFKEEDNLIIKGNNLLALHSIKERYLGKVKLIYIDPPYNTGGDSFLYNDKFNHSTWLTFMKNRLDISKELLHAEGSIWINIDDDESHYLKVLCDSIFGRENFIANIVWQKKYTVSNDAKYFSDNHDHILVYSKNKSNFRVNGLPRNEEMNKRYKNPDNDTNGPWMTQPLHAKSGKNTEFKYTFSNGVEWQPPRGTYPRYTEATLKHFEENNQIWFGNDGKSVPRVKKYLSNMGDVTPSTIWLHNEFGNNDQANKEVRALIDDELFSTPKPEKLLQKIITIGSKENDIVLDFFMGSSTTQAVAHKMKRRFIGIEQMDYITDVSIPRLCKVIEGEQGGVSNDVHWQGGGSFVYAELHSLNKEYLYSIQESANSEELEKVIDRMEQSAYLNFKVDLEKVTTKNKDFNSLSLDEQKDVLIQVLDMNQLYLNYSEIDDSQYEISDSVKAFNHSFYQKEGDQDE